MFRAARGLLVLLALVATTSAARSAEPVDLLLVLAADVSRSVDQAKFQLQREGYAAAIADKRVLDVIAEGRHQRIAVSFVEWSGVSSQRLLIDWSLIDGADAARKFGDQLIELPRSFAERTSISGGIDFAMGVLAKAPYQSTRRTIDVSGDGTNNSGRDVTLARDEAVAQRSSGGLEASSAPGQPPVAARLARPGAASAISAISLRTIAWPNELKSCATTTNAPRPPMTLLRK